MVFDHLSKRLQFLSSNKKDLARLSLEKANDLVSKEKYKQALDHINASIGQGITSNQLLLKKALLLSRNKQYKKAEAIYLKYAKLGDNSKLASKANKLLKESRKNQQEDLTILLKNLHYTANHFQWKLNIPSKPENWTPEGNIAELVCIEAEKARAAQLPKLSANLITLTVEAGFKSPWLAYGKALSLKMMRQSKKAIDLLHKIHRKTKEEALKESIKKSIEEFNNNPEEPKINVNTYIIKQVKRFAQSNKSAPNTFMRVSDINNSTDVKTLVIKQARASLTNNPQASLDFSNSILDFFPENSEALQIKGESLLSLKQNKLALEAFTKLIHKKNKKVATKASKFASKAIARRAKIISSNKTPKDAFEYYIKQHLKHQLTPTLDPDLKHVLNKIQPTINNPSHPELERYQQQLLFNTLLVDYIETQLHEKGRLNTTAPAQKPGAISETAPNVG